MTRRDRIVVIVIAAVALVGVYWFMALAPKRKEATSLGTKIAAQEQRSQEAKTNFAAYKASRSRYEADYAAVARLGKAVPADDDVPALVVQLESAAKRSNVDFRVMKLTGTGAPVTGGALSAPQSAGASQAAATALPPGAAIGPAGFPTMPFSFTFEGNFFDLSAFFARLERFTTASDERILVSGRLLTVDGISLKASQRGFPHMQATVASTAFLLPAGEGLTDGATAAAPSAAAPATTPAKADDSSGSKSPAAPATLLAPRP